MGRLDKKPDQRREEWNRIRGMYRESFYHSTLQRLSSGIRWELTLRSANRQCEESKGLWSTEH